MLNRTTYVGRRRASINSRRRLASSVVTPSGALKGVALVGLVGSVGTALVVPGAQSTDGTQAPVAASTALLRPADSGTWATTAATTVIRDQQRASRTATRTSLTPEEGAAAVDAAVVAPVAPVAEEAAGLSGVKAVAREEVAMPDGGAVLAGAQVAGGGGGLDTATYAGAGAGVGLSANGQAVYSAVRSAFGITNIGGARWGDWGDHGTGHAADIMVPDLGTGDAIAAYVMANASTLGVKYIIWKQAIWFPGSSGWRGMEDRGSITQNHYDHVHVSVN